ncbi:MAG: phosphotransferase family protein [Acidimicrobiales bacterium]
MHTNSDLASQLGERLGGDVDALRRLSGGASRETWSFTVGGRPLILQRERASAVAVGRMATEATLLRAAAEAGVPVPAIVHDGSDHDVPFLVVEHLAGETIPRKLLRDDVFAGVRPLLVDECGRILAAVHRIPLDRVTGLDDVDQVVQFRQVLDMLGDQRPALELGFRWLDANRPAPTARAVVHGDFRTGNLLVDRDGVAAVLDWELAHVGDPLEDLGWFCVRSWRFGSPSPAGGFGPRGDLWRAYEAAGGVHVDPEAARWWEALGTLKWAIMCFVQCRSHLDGSSRSVELAAIGRRVCESESDLLALVSGEGFP